MHNDRQAYNRLRNNYLHEIRKSKMVSWRNMSKNINVNTWGKAFKYAKNGPRSENINSALHRADGTLSNSIDETMDILLDAFVPVDDKPYEFLPQGPLEKFNPVDEATVKNAIWR